MVPPLPPCPQPRTTRGWWMEMRAPTQEGWELIPQPPRWGRTDEEGERAGRGCLTAAVPEPVGMLHSSREQQGWALLDGNCCPKQPWPKSPAPKLLKRIKNRVSPLNDLGFQRRQWYFCSLVSDWDLSYEMLLIRTKGLKPQFCFVPDKARGEFWLWLKVVWGLFDRELLLAEIERKTSFAFHWNKRPSKNSAWLLKTQSQALPFYKHRFPILFYQISKDLLQKIRETVLQKTVDGMRKEGVPYVGMYKTLGFWIIRGTTFYFAFSSL